MYINMYIKAVDLVEDDRISFEGKWWRVIQNVWSEDGTVQITFSYGNEQKLQKFNSETEFRVRTI